MAIEVTPREAYEMKGFIILMGPRRERHGGLHNVLLNYYQNAVVLNMGTFPGIQTVSDYANI